MLALIQYNDPQGLRIVTFILNLHMRKSEA